MMEGWAKGKYPVKEEILKEIAEAETFINKCSDNDIHHYRLICVPWKEVSPYDNTPPRIGLNKNGSAEWIYGEENDGKSDGPLSLKDPNAYGVADPSTTSHSDKKTWKCNSGVHISLRYDRLKPRWFVSKGNRQDRAGAKIQ